MSVEIHATWLMPSSNTMFSCLPTRTRMREVGRSRASREDPTEPSVERSLLPTEFDQAHERCRTWVRCSTGTGCASAMALGHRTGQVTMLHGGRDEHPARDRATAVSDGQPGATSTS